MRDLLKPSIIKVNAVNIDTSIDTSIKWKVTFLGSCLTFNIINQINQIKNYKTWFIVIIIITTKTTIYYYFIYNKWIIIIYLFI